MWAYLWTPAELVQLDLAPLLRGEERRLRWQDDRVREGRSGGIPVLVRRDPRDEARIRVPARASCQWMIRNLCWACRLRRRAHSSGSRRGRAVGSRALAGENVISCMLHGLLRRTGVMRLS
jgi:hypothetical protein